MEEPWQEDELAQPIEKFIPIYRRAKEEGLRLKAHIGEWGTAEDVARGVKVLQLDEVSMVSQGRNRRKPYSS